ncbi:hypothetical protein L7F22_042666 [Adiantum nelumboides]|nr:hypothetical protein [Adiantum nelumboides]
MDSCNSSPSHSFKDRPRSHHGDLPRQPSFPHAVERAKSPAGKGALESAFAGTRDLARRSYGDCSADKNGGDGLLSSPERSRSLLRRPFGFERIDRQRDSKNEMHRSARSCTPSRNADRDSGETGGRLANKRSSHGELAHRPEILEGVSSSPLHGEREASGGKGGARKGYDRDGEDMKWQGSASPDIDREPSKSPVSGKPIMRGESKEAVKVSPRRPLVTSGFQSARKDVTLEKDCSGSSLGRKDASERGKFSPPIKASTREVHDDVDATSSKTKPCKFRDLDKLKEQEVSSTETEARSWSKNFFPRSRSGGDDTLEGEQLHDVKSTHEDACREMSPMSFLHVSKRVRSDRDRGRRDEHAGKSSARPSHWNEFVKTDSRKASPTGRSGYDSHRKESIEDDDDAIHGAKENEEFSARNIDNGVVHANEESVENMEKDCRVPYDGDNSDMEEGELEPERDAMIRPNLPEEKSTIARKGDESKVETCYVSVKAPKGKELCEGQLKVAVGGEDELVLKQDEIRQVRDDNSKTGHDGEKSLLPEVKEEKQGSPLEAEAVNAQFKNSQVSTSKVLELGESSRSGVLFDLLGAKTEPKSWNLHLSAHNTIEANKDNTVESSKELTLSLFTNPNATLRASSQAKGDTHPKGSNGKQIEKLQKLETGGGEESSQLSGHKQKKLKMESLQLSLALPGSSIVAGVPDPSQSAAPVEPARSFQSLNQTQTHTQNFLQSQTYTNSDGFTSSFSFSQSESFIHNPSCSLNCTSLENQELSCGGTRQLSQGTEQMSNRSWPALSGNEHGMHTVTSVSHDKSKHRRGIPLYQRVLQNGNMHQGFPSVTGSNRSSGSNHFSQRSHHYGQRLQEAPKILDSSCQDLDGSVMPATTSKDILERVRQQKAWFASKQQAMSAEPRLESNTAQDRDKPSDPSAANVKGPGSTGKDIMVGERNVLNDKIGLHEITTDPVAVMAQKLQELPDSVLEGLKGVAKGVLGSFEKREEFIALQENIRRRTDLTEDSLLRAHRTQLEILVALKTGIQAFVQEGSKPQTYKALIEIFLQTRCRNIACQQPLSVCGWECRVCSKKSGFCHECMCVVCFKFDSDNNTCRWLGCDLCLHWCHTDCGLRMSYITPTPTAQNTSGGTEMQYHCVACDHKSELYGFVKDVFQNCVETWGAETLAKELDCVRRIFHGSEDMRGKQLCWKAEQMLQKLENKIDVAEVRRSMLRFFHEGNAELDGACGPVKRSPSMKANDSSSRMAEAARESAPKGTSSGGSKLVDTDDARAVLQKSERNVEEKRTEAAELQYDRARKKAEIEDIESAVRIKQAEAKMFQIRADEARQDAGGLQRIISVKREKIDEDYACKYAKLRLNEAEERHQKRFEELKVLENAQQDFQKMKIRMEGEIKELMVKMEMAKRQFA